MVASAERLVKHKKRHGQHQRQSKSFLRVYTPYLPLFLSVTISLVFIFTWGKKTSEIVQSASTGVSASSLLESTNNQRFRHGKKELVLNNALDQAAQAKANDMVSQNYWSHDTPSGNSPWFFVETAGYAYTKASENLAYGFTSSKDIVAGWMNSPLHRGAMLDSEYSDVGFGSASSSNYDNNGAQLVVVAFYGTKASVSHTASTLSGATRIKNASTENQSIRNSVPSGTYTINRVQIATAGLAPAITIAVIAVASAGIAILGTRHLMAFKRLLKNGEKYVVKRPLVDVTVVVILIACVILTRSAGFVR